MSNCEFSTELNRLDICGFCAACVAEGRDQKMLDYTAWRLLGIEVSYSELPYEPVTRSVPIRGALGWYLHDKLVSAEHLRPLYRTLKNLEPKADFGSPYHTETVHMRIWTKHGLLVASRRVERCSWGDTCQHGCPEAIKVKGVINKFYSLEEVRDLARWR